MHRYLLFNRISSQGLNTHQTKNQKKSSVKKSKSLGQKTAAPLAIALSILIPKKKGRKGRSLVNKTLRKTLEFKKVKQIIGLNLTSLLVFVSFYQPYIFTPDNLPPEVEKTEITSIVTQEVVATESTFQMPVRGYISQYYSWYHPGIDLAGNDFAPIYPVASGRVVQIEYSRFGYGINILVDHGDQVISRYAHLRSVNVVLNQKVDKDTCLGKVGSTGLSTGPHLHLEIYQSGKAVNPLALIRSSDTFAKSDKYEEKKEVVIIASPQKETSAEQIPTVASMSAEVSKQTVEGFIEPTAYNYTNSNTASSSSKTN
jgi:murein DD-endopeptidase MepM/ murein hydrolase activator NlpD